MEAARGRRSSTVARARDVPWDTIMNMSVYFVPARAMDGCWCWMCVSKGKIDSMCGNSGHFWVLITSNGGVFWCGGGCNQLIS